MGSAKALEVLGWFVIIIGIIAGIIVIAVFGKTPVEGYTYLKETNPVGIAIGLGIMFEHLIFGAFLIVIAHIGQNVYDIKRKLFGEAAMVDIAEQVPASPGDEKTDTPKPTKEKEYMPKHEKPTENDQLAIDARKTCWHCKHFTRDMFSGKGRCDVFKQKVNHKATCKYFERGM